MDIHRCWGRTLIVGNPKIKVGVVKLDEFVLVLAGTTIWGLSSSLSPRVSHLWQRVGHGTIIVGVCDSLLIVVFIDNGERVANDAVVVDHGEFDQVVSIIFLRPCDSRGGVLDEVAVDLELETRKLWHPALCVDHSE